MIRHRYIFIVALALLLVTAGTAANRLIFLQHAKRVDGKVASITGRSSQCGSSRRGTRFECTRFNAVVVYPVFETGKDMSLSLDAGMVRGRDQPATRAELKKGEAVPVLYDLRKPEIAYKDSFSSIWRTPLICMIMQLLLGPLWWFMGGIPEQRPEVRLRR